MSDNNKLQEIIRSAVEETFEEMAFLEVCPVKAPEEPPDEEHLLRASLLVHDPFPGEICLVAPRLFITGVAKGLFAVEEEDIADSTLLDLLAELLNTIAGRVMNEMTPEGVTFRLGLPEPGAESFSDEGSGAVECCFDVDGEVFFVTASGEPLLAGGASS